MTQRAECPSSPLARSLNSGAGSPRGKARGACLGSWAQGVLGTVGVRPAQPPPDFAKSYAGDWRLPLFPPPWVFPTCISADAEALVFCP